MKATTLLLALAIASLSGLSIASKPTPPLDPAASATPVRCAVAPVDPLLTRLREIPPEQFVDLPSLEAWANSSTVGGGTVQTILAGDTVEVAIAFRSHTSRYESSDVIVYSRLRLKEARPWQLVTHRQPVFRDLVEASVSEDRLEFRTVSGGRTLLALPFSGLEPVVPSSQIREIDLLSHFSIDPAHP